MTGIALDQESSLASRSGERKQVTVLFADLANSTRMIRGLDPEESVQLLDRIMRGMVAAVQAEGGRVLRLQGDGVKAVFGAPVAQEDHAERACLAAIRIQDFAQAQNVRLRVGLHSGEVVTSSIALEQGLVYDAGGMAVHLAARIEQVATPGSICISAATASLIRARFPVRPLKPRRAKGVAEPIALFALASRGPTRSRWEGRAAAGLAPLVGRVAELKFLRDALGLVASGEGQALALTGPPGIGKSRLVFELLAAPPAKDWTVLRVAAEATDVHTGLRPFANMIRQWFGVRPESSPADVRQRLRSRLTAQHGFDAADQQAIAALLDVGSAESDGAVVADLRDKLVRAIGKLLRACATPDPAILVVEDAHWLDSDSLELLRAIMSAVRPLPAAVLVTLRPGYANAGLEQQADLCIEVPPFNDEEASRLIETWLAAHRSLAALKEQIVQRAGGTPFFLEEMVKEVVEGGVLLRQDAASQATAAAASLRLPPTLNALLSERLDRLPSHLKDLAQLLATIGQEAPLPLLAHLLAAAPTTVEQLCLDLQRLEMVTVSGPADDRRLRFKHALIQEAAYESLLTTDRRVIHQRVMKAYETLYPKRREEHAEILAHHAQQAQLQLEALRYLKLAATRAIQRSSHSRAITYATGALEIIGKSGIIENNLELELRLLLRTAFNAIGNYRERLFNLDRAQALAITTRRQALLPEIMMSRASVLLQLGDPEEALEICRKADRMAAAEGSKALRVRAGYTLARSNLYNGRPKKSLEIASATLKLLETADATTPHGGGFGAPTVMLLTQIAQAQAALGNLAEAVKTGDEALRIAIASRREWDIGLASFGLGVAWLYRNDMRPALPALERALRGCEAAASRESFLGLVTVMLGYAAVQSGDVRFGVELCRKAMAIPEESYHHSNWIRLCCAAAFREARLFTEAAKLAQDAHLKARRWNYPLQVAWSDLQLALLHADDQPRTARRHLERVMQLARERQLRPFLAMALVLSSRLATRTTERQALWNAGTQLARKIGLPIEQPVTNAAAE